MGAGLVPLLDSAATGHETVICGQVLPGIIDGRNHVIGLAANALKDKDCHNADKKQNKGILKQSCT